MTHLGRCVFVAIRESHFIEGGTVVQCVKGCGRIRVRPPEGYTTKAASDRARAS
jgi:hypothetical protein